MDTSSNITAALAFIPATDRETWVRMAMAVKDGLGESGFQLWDDWSQSVPSYNAKDAADVWRSCKEGGPITVRTLFHEAQQRGYRANGSSKPTPPTAEELAERKQRQAEAEAKLAADRAKGAEMATATWAQCQPAPIDHGYIARKRGLPDGIRVYRGPMQISGQAVDGWLAVPVMNLAGDVGSIQFIPEKGAKLNLPGASLPEDGHLVIGGAINGVAYVVEGIGQAWTAHQVTGKPAVVTFGFGRMAKIAHALRSRYPDALLTIVPDAGKVDQAAAIAASVGGRFVDLPAGWPSNRDINDEFVSAGPEAVRAILDNAKGKRELPPANRWQAPSPIDSGEWDAARTSPDVIVADYLWADVATLIAPGGTGKTTLELFEAIHIVLGLPLWGFEICRPGPVVIITAEDSREILVARIRCIARELGLSNADIQKVQAGILISDVSGMGFKLTLVDGEVVVPSARCDEIVRALRPVGPSLIVIDPAVSFGVGESRINDAEQGLIDAARRLRNGLNCCVRYVHHTGKASARDKIVDQYAGRGGSAMADGSRMVHVLTAIDADEWFAETGQALDNGENAIRVVRPKQSYGKPNPPDLLIKRSGFNFKRARALENGKTAMRDANADMVHRFLVSELGENKRHTRNTLEGALEIRRVDLRVAVDWLMTSGRVENRKIGKSAQRGAREYLHPIVDAVVGSPDDVGEARLNHG